MMRFVTLASITTDRGLVGGPFGSSLVSSDYRDVGVPVIRGVNMSVGKYIGGKFAYVSQHKFERDLVRNTASSGDLIFTQRGTLGQVALVPPSGQTYIVSQSQMRLRVDPAVADAEYVYYACTTDGFLKQTFDNAITTGVPHTNLGILGRLEIPLPELSAQRAIAEVLGALDDKIASNTRQVTLLDSHMALQYDAAIETASVSAALDELAVFHNRRRVPLSASERAARVGTIPYYGATGVFGYVDQPLFDEPLVLVGEDGSVINDDGTPVVQYVWGPSWVNNHAHVLTGTAISTEVLYQAVRREQVTTLVTGAVQPKINMGNLKRLVLTVPTGTSLEGVSDLIGAETALKRSLTEEIRLLTATRDALLPQLMSGKLRVRDAEAAASEALS